MASGICASCRQILADEDNNKLADIIEEQHTNCACEKYSVGLDSPGPVADNEALHRLIISPRDVDPVTGTIFARPFEKAFGNGLSVCRALASDDDIVALVREGLASGGPTQILSICDAQASTVRALKDDTGSGIFCVYDQTVTRVDLLQKPVPTHAGIFGRRPPPKTPDRKRIQKDYAGKLREIFINGLVSVPQFRSGLLVAGASAGNSAPSH